MKKKRFRLAVSCVITLLILIAVLGALASLTGGATGSTAPALAREIILNRTEIIF